MTQLALTLLSIAVATPSTAPTTSPQAQLTTQSEQDRKDYEAYEATLREVNAEADRIDRARFEADSSVRPLAPAVPTPTRAVAMLGTPALTSQAGSGATQSSASRAAPATLVAAYAPAPAPAAARAAVAQAPDPSAPAGCSLFAPGYATVPTEKCLQCHGLSRTHPVDIDYEGTIQRNPAFMYRPVAEVIKRGVFLPNGQIACVTCHDANSPWKDRIALPPGAKARPAVDPRNRDTYASPETQPAAALPAHSAVTPTPLCQACHTYGD